VALARLGLGSNLGDAAANVEAALAALAELGRVAGRSALYASAPWGVTDQPEFVNAAALLDTPLAPHELLAGLKALEVRLGRTATYRWGPRAIDLDILAYDDLHLDDPDLTIPHARLFERAFALAPLAEIDPAYLPAYENLPAAERAAVRRLPGRIGSLAARTARPVNWDQTVERVRRAAAFCVEAGLERFRIDDDDVLIEVRRNPAIRPEAAAPEAEANGATGESAPLNGEVAHALVPSAVLKAEFVGIVRFARPAVAEGSEVSAERELAYVEALGIRNPIRAGNPGRVAAVYVTDGEPVEYGQPLFAIETEA
jgi:2-amino-4-hydroxy-6-hydroxymethyldihydropteridine diphosphokinase